MTSYVALLRGINVGGKHILPMQDLRDIFASLGCANVQTYIQSGNAVISAAADAKSLAAQIEETIAEKFGFAPNVLLLPSEEFQAIAAANPYPEAVDTPKHLHVSFLEEMPANPDIDALNMLKSPSEAFTLTDKAFYLFAPDGIGRSKLAASVERHLGVSATGRNWRTVTKLLSLVV